MHTCERADREKERKHAFSSTAIPRAKGRALQKPGVD